MTEETAAMLGRWKQRYRDGDVAAVVPDVGHIALRIVTRNLFGADVGPTTEAIENDFTYANHIMGDFFRFPFPPLHWPTPSHLKLRKLIANLDRFVAETIELLHNALLIHDDIMDGDRVRRHRPTVWVRFGVPRALLAGDALIALGFEVLADRRRPATAPRWRTSPAPCAGWPWGRATTCASNGSGRSASRSAWRCSAARPGRCSAAPAGSGPRTGPRTGHRPVRRLRPGSTASGASATISVSPSSSSTTSWGSGATRP
ncbi:hypothetical protein STRAU_1915 [Streptomyces aurantiacus JA 4570]|uniref:Uncharacterized protein n=1 Tax=Streptomyces aurantiacus JA 4570 TaxID=1286094 RepID=S3ZQB9_9ACTN|nr:polyprenyl synthetase family protein [Streptomyces aurantiacus]EPH45014.1 hypothetical protein STRAU_1915 [Streptomyces aurantiacus JA 4570]